MKGATHFAGTAAHYVALVILSLSVALFIPLAVLVAHVSEPASLKGWLQDSDAYATTLDSVFGALVKDRVDESAEGDNVASDVFKSNVLNKASLANAVKTAIGPEYLQGQTENVIDGIYDWLEGRENRPVFTFSFTDKKDDIIKALTNEINAQVSKLPTCSQAVDGSSLEAVLQAGCLPPGLSVGELTNQAVQDITGNDELFDKLSFSGDDLLKDKDNQDGLDQQKLDEIPRGYNNLLVVPIVLLIIAAISALIVLLVTKPRFTALKNIGYALISASIWTFIISVIVTRISGSFESSLAGSSEPEVQAVIQPLVRTIVNDLAGSTAWVAGIILGSGIVLIIAGSIWRREKLKHHQQNHVDTATSDAKSTS